MKQCEEIASIATKASKEFARGEAEEAANTSIQERTVYDVRYWKPYEPGIPEVGDWVPCGTRDTLEQAIQIATKCQKEKKTEVWIVSYRERYDPDYYEPGIGGWEGIEGSEKIYTWRGEEV